MALYGTGVFGLLQLADIVFPAVGLPEAAVTWLVVLCIAGFPVALFVAWSFDLTSHGWERTGVAQGAEIEAILALPRTQRWAAGLLGLSGVGLLMAGSWWIGSSGGAGQQAAAAEAPPFVVRSVAVLPFVNMGSPQDEPFSDGLAEELGNALGAIDGLRVAARTSAFTFKGRNVDARTIGRELNVGAIVEGSVRRSGGSVRISARLSRTSDGFQVWSKSWQRDMTAANVFAIQDEITAEIARALTPEARPAVRVGLEDRRTSVLEAYELYLLGRHRWASRDVEAVYAAIRDYEQAIALDSAFALAWTGLADAWSVLPFYDLGLSGAEAYTQAVRSADRALALAPDLAEANAARGIIATEYEADFATGSRLLARAIDLNPSYAQAHAWLCETLAIAGRDAAALPACDRALELNPFGLIPNLMPSIPLDGLGRTEDALAQIDRAVALDPNLTFAHFLRSGLLLRLGRTDEAAESLERIGRGLGASDPASLRQVAGAYPGDRPSPRAIEAVRAFEAETGPGLYYVAAFYGWAGARDDAIRVVEEAAATRNPWLGIAAVFSAWDGLRPDPRFQAILRDTGLPNGSTVYRSGRTRE